MWRSAIINEIKVTLKTFALTIICAVVLTVLKFKVSFLLSGGDVVGLHLKIKKLF
jgi:hypothetical protein